MGSVVPLSACRICGNARLESVLDLGVQALTGIFPSDPARALTRGPLRLVKCTGGAEACGLVQLADTYDLAEMYGHEYGYRSGLNASMVRHLGEKVAELVRRRPLRDGELVLDIGSNDGTTLGFYPKNVRRLGIDPTTEKFRKFHPEGIEAVADFFSASSFSRVSNGAKASIVTSISMFYDLPDPSAFVRDVASVLADDGVWHLEQSYLPTMLDTLGYDTVCHEHLEYYALTQLKYMMSRAGLCIVDVSMNDVNGGSFAVTVRKGDVDAPEVAVLLEREAPLQDPATWRAFAERVAHQRDALVRELVAAKRAGLTVYALGASTKGNVVLQYCDIGPELLQGVAEVNPDKFGAYTPGTLIPILAEDEVMRRKPDVLLVLPWHFRATFEKAFRPFIEGGGRLLFPLPTLEYVGG